MLASATKAAAVAAAAAAAAARGKLDSAAAVMLKGGDRSAWLFANYRCLDERSVDLDFVFCNDFVEPASQRKRIGGKKK